MDTVCIKPFVFTDDLVLASEQDYYTNSIIFARPNHPLLISMEKLVRETPNKEGRSFATIGGSTALTEYIKTNNLQNYAKPVRYFIPFDWCDWHTAFDKTYADDIEFFATTYSVHLYNEMGRLHNGFNKNAMFDSESLYEQLKSKHGITNSPTAKRITSEQLHKAIIDNKITAIANRKTRINRERILFLLIAFVIGLILYMKLFN